MAKLYKQRCGDNWQRMQRLVQAVFTQNQLRRRRQFDNADVFSALQAAASVQGAPDTLEEQQQLWNQAVENEAVPFVRTLMKPAAAKGASEGDSADVTAAPPLQLHPVRRGAVQLYAMADLCQVCGVDRAAADKFAAGLTKPGERHEASWLEVGVLRDQEVLEAAKAVTQEYGHQRGRVTVIGGGRKGDKYHGQDGVITTVIRKNGRFKVRFDDGGDDSFEPGSLVVLAEPVLLLGAEKAAALLANCGCSVGVAAALEAYLAAAGNAGLFQATHLSLQESVCAEAFRNAALEPAKRPPRADGMFKWFDSKAEATVFLNDSWYRNTLALVRSPGGAEGQLALGRALFPPGQQGEEQAGEKEKEGLLAVGGFALKSLTANGVQALLDLTRALGPVTISLSKCWLPIQELSTEAALDLSGVGLVLEDFLVVSGCIR
jgi:hypothetical protein